MMTIYKLIVSKKDPKKLGSFLLKNGFSHQALIKARHHGGMVLVNHKRRYNSFMLKVGDVVHFIPAQEKQNKFLKASNKPIKIVFETKNYLLVNKSANVLSIPSRYEDDDALVNRVMGHFVKENKQDLKPHVITRLDRDTSGLVLIGKNAIAHARFSKLGKDKFIKKYHAIVEGNFDKTELSGLIDRPIAKIGTGVKRTVRSDGQKAQTEYRVLAQKEDVSLVEVRLLTGRTHQIRVHFASIGHPLIGDKLYGGRMDLPRQALNCFYLSFPDPFSDKNETIKIDDPVDMRTYWENLAK